MREILHRAKRNDSNGWVEGSLVHGVFYTCDTGRDIHYILDVDQIEDYEYFSDLVDGAGYYEIDTDTICQYTELNIEDTSIWKNDILEYDGDGCARCIGVVKYGNYIQDGSGGEYSGKECIGFYVEMIKLIPYEWEDESVEEILEYFPHYYKKYSLAEILKQKDVKKIGNIFDNPELLERQ